MATALPIANRSRTATPTAGGLIQPIQLASRACIAAVWIYNGLWLKLLQPSDHHTDIVASVPGWATYAAWITPLIGAVEVLLAAWVLAAWRPRTAAWVQTQLLAAMNFGGIFFAGDRIADPAGMVLGNLCLVLLIWTLAPDREEHHA